MCACRGKILPSLMEARIDSPLSVTHGLNTDPDAMATRNLPVVDGADGAPRNGNTTTMV